MNPVDLPPLKQETAQAADLDFRDPSLMADFVSRHGIEEHASGVALPKPVKWTEDI